MKFLTVLALTTGALATYLPNDNYLHIFGQTPYCNRSRHARQSSSSFSVPAPSPYYYIPEMCGGGFVPANNGPSSTIIGRQVFPSSTERGAERSPARRRTLEEQREEQRVRCRQATNGSLSSKARQAEEQREKMYEEARQAENRARQAEETAKRDIAQAEELRARAEREKRVAEGEKTAAELRARLEKMEHFLLTRSSGRERHSRRFLGVGPDADLDEIKRVHRLQSLLYHPDKNKTNPDAAAKFRLIQEAYDADQVVALSLCPRPNVENVRF